MSNEQANQLIVELIAELEQESAVDSETIVKAKSLQQSMADTLSEEADIAGNTLLDDAIALEASFAAQHPVAEKLVRELVNTLSRLGI
ncbi:MAG: DUF4404 family protein [Pseudohongiellaceae bacterium]